VYRSPSLAGSIAVGGKLDSGSIMIGDHVLLLPQHELLAVKSLRLHEHGSGPSASVYAQTTSSELIARAGDNIEMGLIGLNDVNVLSAGNILCDPLYPVPMVTLFRAQIITLEYKVPILKGSQALLYTSSCRTPVVVCKLVALLNRRNGKVVRKKPRRIPRNASAIVDIRVAGGDVSHFVTNMNSMASNSGKDDGTNDDGSNSNSNSNGNRSNRSIVMNTKAIWLETYARFRAFGRFTLRRGVKTIAVGIVMQLKKTV